MEKNYQDSDQQEVQQPDDVSAPRNERPIGERTARLIEVNEVIERVIAIAVVVFLVVTAVLILFSSARELAQGIGTGGSEYNLTKILSEILLALMIAEIIGTVSSFLREGIFNPVPFLVVGIIASVRRLLVISAESAEFFSAGEEIPIAILVELGILTVTIGVCSWAITALRTSYGHGARTEIR